MSKIHCHTTVAVSAGIAQAKINDVETSRRIFDPRLLSSRAMSTPSDIVSATFDDAEHQRAPQHLPEVRVPEQPAEVAEPDPRRRGAEHLRHAVLLARLHDQPHHG